MLLFNCLKDRQPIEESADMLDGLKFHLPWLVVFPRDYAGNKVASNPVPPNSSGEDNATLATKECFRLFRMLDKEFGVLLTEILAEFFRYFSWVSVV